MLYNNIFFCLHKLIFYYNVKFILNININIKKYVYKFPAVRVLYILTQIILIKMLHPFYRQIITYQRIHIHT